MAYVMRYLALLPIAGLLASVGVAPAQDNMEGLGPILERGYVAHWLVCGPFEPDVPGGLLAAVRDDAAALGDTDFMATRAGIARMRPAHLMRVPKADGTDAIWQRAGTTGPELDLAPFFPDENAGIAYAAFYVSSPSLTQVLLDVESPLGVRAWANGFPVADYEPGPLGAVGKDFIAVGLRRGANLVVFQVPGADYTAMARARGLSTGQLTAGPMANRPRLRKTSGFALSVKVYDARGLGKSLLYAPDLRDAGTFSGYADNLKQDVLLTIHNPLDTISEPVQALVSTPAMSLPDVLDIDALDAGETREITVSLPIGGVSPGESIPVSVRLSSGGAEGGFSDRVTVREGAGDRGVVRVVTGHTMAAGGSARDDGAYLSDVKRQVLFWQQASGYGFDMGYASEWHKPFVGLPALRDELKSGAQQGGITVRGTYAPVDERVVGEYALWRNLQFGLHMAGSLLKSSTPHYLPWDLPGIAPQTAQLLGFSPMDGIVTNLDTPGLLPLSRLRGLDGDTIYLRRKLVAEGPASVEDLREMAALQRRELLGRDVPSDVLVVEHLVPPPEPFYRGSTGELARAVPRIRLDDGGAARFFEDVATLDENRQTDVPPVAVDLNLGQPGGLWSMPALQHTHHAVARQLEYAEAMATLAGLQGAIYPHAAMEFAGRQLLYYSSPGVLGTPEDDKEVLDALAGYREVAEWTADTARRSGEFLAGLVDTAGSVPLNQGEFRALVVFNPTAVEATAPVEARIPAESDAGLMLVDANEQPVSFVARPHEGEQIITFIAEGLPPYGYATYFARAAENQSRPIVGEDLQIENDHLALFLDPETGTIQSILDKSRDIEVGAGTMNAVVLLPENEAENREGRELWTRPPNGSPATPARITSEHSPIYERIRVTTPLDGGTLEQVYTLYSGVPWVECETVLDGVSLSGKAAAATFAFPHRGRAFMAGERFGAVVAARGQDNDVLKTRGGENAAGTVSYPAHAWAALSPNDALRVGPDNVLPWEPAIIVYGQADILQRAARDLQQALITRGIPSILQPDVPDKPDFLWTDSTTEKDSNAYLRAGYRMRIVIGSPDQNQFCRGVLAQTSAEMAAAYTERIPSGAKLLVNDANVPAGLDPVPTLLLSGLTPAQSAGMADDLSRAVRTGQHYLLPPSASAIDSLPRAADGGCALLFPGAMPVSQQSDGRLLVGLRHRGPLDRRKSDSADLLDRAVFRYAIYPFAGTWRDAKIPMAAAQFDVKPIAVLTGIHPGPLPASQRFLEISPPGLRVTGLKPAGFPSTTNTRTAYHPRNGFTLLAWEPSGTRWSGVLRGSGAVLEAQSTDVLESPQAPWPVSGPEVELELGGFEVMPLWFLPADPKPLDGLARLGREEDPFGVIETRYWDERRGAAPLRKMPLGLLLRGTLTGETPAIEVVVSNHATDRVAQGTVELEATSGLSFGPQDFYYNLAPGKQHVETIQVARTPGMEAEMGLVAETEFEGQTYRDVKMTNEAPYVLEATRNGAQLRVAVRNNSTIRARGFLDAIAAPEHWPELPAYPSTSILPRRATISIPPFKSQTIVFTFSEPGASVPVVLKLAANGLVQYLPVASRVPAQTTDPNAEGAPQPPPPRDQS